MYSVSMAYYIYIKNRRTSKWVLMSEFNYGHCIIYVALI